MLNWIVRNRIVFFILSLGVSKNCVYKLYIQYICKNKIWHEITNNGWYTRKPNQTKPKFRHELSALWEIFKNSFVRIMMAHNLVKRCEDVKNNDSDFEISFFFTWQPFRGK